MKVSHPDRVIFPLAQRTKADVIGHYVHVTQLMMPFLAGRPLTLERFPRGVDAKGFMQKNAGKHFPESIERFAVSKRDGSSTMYPVIHDPGDIAYLANQGTVTFHMWTATAARPDHPDWLVIDLDPEAGDLDGVRFAATAIRTVLDQFSLTGFVLATGSKGFHIWIRLDGSRSFSDVSLATRALAGLAAQRHPDRLTTEFLKRDRTGRVFVDWLRNTAIATVVVPWSLRPRAEAPVAVPLAWDELAQSRPDQWTLGDIDDRLAFEIPDRQHTLPLEAIVAAARDVGVDLDTPHNRFGRSS